MRRVLELVAAFVASVILLTLAVANRHPVRLVLDPFNPADPVIAVELPFYAYLFGVLILGVAAGGVATWLTQGKWRRMARSRAQEAIRWKAESDRLAREREAGAAPRTPRVAIAGR